MKGFADGLESDPVDEATRKGEPGAVCAGGEQGPDQVLSGGPVGVVVADLLDRLNRLDQVVQGREAGVGVATQCAFLTTQRTARREMLEQEHTRPCIKVTGRVGLARVPEGPVEKGELGGLAGMATGRRVPR